MDWKSALMLGVAALLALLLVCVVAWLIVRQLMPESGAPPAGPAVRLGAQPNPEMPDETPFELPLIGPYQIERQLGHGAMGVVYFGREQETGREVAVKTMALELEFDSDQLADARARFFREAETASRLQHPGIVNVLASGEDHGLAWIAMEYLTGRSLVEWTQPDHLLPLTDVLSIVRQAALALDYAHKQKVVHRDIKPANVMYNPDTRKIKLTDFGVARMTDAHRTRTGLVLGTPSFMSPEQLAGKHIDSRSDLFSLGVMLYQLASGQLPFNGDSLGQLMYAIAHNPPASLADDSLPPPLQAIILKALQKDVNARFQTGAHFALALARLEASIKKGAQHA